METNPELLSQEFIKYTSALGADQPMVIITRSGREHNVVIEEVGTYYVSCRVGLIQEILLSEHTRNGKQLAFNFSHSGYIDKLKETCQSQNFKIFVDERVFIKAEQHLTLRLEDISVAERVGLPYFPSYPTTVEGKVDYQMVVEVVPQLSYYFNGKDGFSIHKPNIVMPGQTQNIVFRQTSKPQ